MSSKLDLTLVRVLDVPKRLVWEAWTNPEHLKRWWAPKPVVTSECEMDVRPGGVMRTVMILPDGTEYPNVGVFLEVIHEEKIVMTDALGPGYRPSNAPFMTAIITFSETDGKTTYTATALHKDEETRNKHEQMGFFDGWGTAAAQLEAVAKSLL